MDGPSTKKSTSLETLVIQNLTNVNELKEKLNDITKSGKDYAYDVSSCLKSLLKNSDQEIVLLTVQAISELAKCDDKRLTYANEEILEPIIALLSKDITVDRTELVKQCCRALGNLSCDCDIARKVISELNGVSALTKTLKKAVENNFDEIKILASKTLLNFAIGGRDFSDMLTKDGFLNLIHKIIVTEVEKDDMDDDTVSTTLLILSVLYENNPEIDFGADILLAVLKVLKETTNVEISELCLEHLHAQAEHGDAAKTLIAKEGGIQLVSSRLEQLVTRHEAGDLNAEDSEVESLIKQACDLIIIVLTGDEAMHLLYNNGLGEVYLTMVKWLRSTNYHVLSTAILAIGNFARQDDYCIHMVTDGIFDQLLDIFEIYHGFNFRLRKDPNTSHPIEPTTVNKILHGVVSALRNLLVPSVNKRVVAAKGRCAPMLLQALPDVEDHHVAYKLLSAIRMLVDGQEGVAKQIVNNEAVLTSISCWGASAQLTGAAGEAPRLLAWTIKQLNSGQRCLVVKVNGCVSNLVNMLVASHSIMQNEAILALTLLAIDSLNDSSDPDYEKLFTSQLIDSEIGKHASVLIETNCGKMPLEVAENLLAFLDITSKKNKIALDYKEAKVPEALNKIVDARKDFSSDMKSVIVSIISAISNGNSQ